LIEEGAIAVGFGDLVNPPQVGLVNLHIHSLIYLGEVFGLATAHNGRGYVRLGKQPGDGQLVNSDVVSAGYLLQFLYNIEDLVHQEYLEIGVPLGGAGVFGQRLATAIFTGEDPTTQRPVEHHSDVEPLAERHDFVLHRPVQDIVLTLHRHERLPVVQRTNAEHMSHLPGVMVADANVSDFALLDESIKRGQSFLYGRVDVRVVKLVEVNIVSLQTTQTVFHGIHQVHPRAAHAIGAVVHPVKKLCSNNDLLAPAL